MAGYNRHLREDPEVIGARVRGNVEVECGDLMYWNPNDYYAEPFTKVISATRGDTISGIIKLNFLGVALEGSPSGSTESIGVAPAGVMRFPLSHAPSAVTVGALVCAVSPAIGGSAGVSDQYVSVTPPNASVFNGTTGYLGYVVKTESGASYVDFQMRSTFGPGGIVT